MLSGTTNYTTIVVPGTASAATATAAANGLNLHHHHRHPIINNHDQQKPSPHQVPISITEEDEEEDDGMMNDDKKMFKDEEEDEDGEIVDDDILLVDDYIKNEMLIPTSLSNPSSSIPNGKSVSPIKDLKPPPSFASLFTSPTKAAFSNSSSSIPPRLSQPKTATMSSSTFIDVSPDDDDEKYPTVITLDSDDDSDQSSSTNTTTNPTQLSMLQQSTQQMSSRFTSNNQYLRSIETIRSQLAAQRGQKRKSALTAAKRSPFARRKIHNIISLRHLSDVTRKAKKEDRKKHKRIEEKKRIIEAEFDEKYNDRVVLDFDLKTKEIVVEVPPTFVPYLKRHQIEGVRFLFNSSIESVERLKKDDTDRTSYGGILAHCMGLGKTLQVICFITTIFHNRECAKLLRTCLVIVPLNVLRNWQDEFAKWFAKCGLERQFEIYELNSVTKEGRDRTLNAKRADYLLKWLETGGVMLVTPGLFSKLILNKDGKQTQYEQETIRRCLTSEPGPDLVIIDEGHCLKNEKTNLSKATQEIATPRRLILTGTPMQNNLMEYYTMVSFVKPNLLGTSGEFTNQYGNPIQNGQYANSTLDDVKLMKRRFFVLHKSLEHCTIHRKSFDVLEPELPKRHEYVFELKLTKMQVGLYQYYLDNYTLKDRKPTKEEKDCLFLHFNILGFIWNHPLLLLKYFAESKKRYEAALAELRAKRSKQAAAIDGGVASPEGVEDLVDHDWDQDAEPEELEMGFDDSSGSTGRSRRRRRNGGGAGGGRRGGKKGPGFGMVKRIMDTWTDLPSQDDLLDLKFSAKFIFLFNILTECERAGDKLLVFSQSLLTLDLIELFLKRDQIFSSVVDYEQSYSELKSQYGTTHRWGKDVDYFRIDGSVSSDKRARIIQHFNDPERPEARLLLISTKAGCVGINLVGANRAIIFDTCWNPALDTQAIYRIYRYGQTKDVFIYRFAAHGTMEQKIYKRQIQKQSLALRVVDEHQVERHYDDEDLRRLYLLEHEDEGVSEDASRDSEPETYLLPPEEDKLIHNFFRRHQRLIVSYHQHNSLLEDLPGERLSKEEESEAWSDFLKAGEPLPPPPPPPPPTMSVGSSFQQYPPSFQADQPPLLQVTNPYFTHPQQQQQSSTMFNPQPNNSFGTTTIQQPDASTNWNNAYQPSGQPNYQQPIIARNGGALMGFASNQQQQQQPPPPRPYYPNSTVSAGNFQSPAGNWMNTGGGFVPPAAPSVMMPVNPQIGLPIGKPPQPTVNLADLLAQLKQAKAESEILKELGADDDIVTSKDNEIRALTENVALLAPPPAHQASLPFAHMNGDQQNYLNAGANDQQPYQTNGSFWNSVAANGGGGGDGWLDDDDDGVMYFDPNQQLYPSAGLMNSFPAAAATTTTATTGGATAGNPSDFDPLLEMFNE